MPKAIGILQGLFTLPSRAQTEAFSVVTRLLGLLPSCSSQGGRSRKGVRIQERRPKCRGFLAICLAALLVGTVPPAYAGDDIQCAIYAKKAVEQNKENLAKGCGFTGQRWSSDKQHHAAWCLGVPKSWADSETVARAKALEKCGADPKCTIEMSTLVQLKSIKVLDEGDGAGNAEPYLWPLFFKIDLRTIGADFDKPLDNWIYAPNGSHGNIGNNWDAGDVIPIPYQVGLWHTHLSSLLLPKDSIIVGALVVLMEEDGVPPSSVISSKAYPAFVDNATKEFKKGILDAIKDAFAPGGGGFAGVDLRKKVEKQIQDTLKDKFGDPWWTWLGVLVFLPLFVNVDDFIGVALFTWTWQDLKANPHQTFSRTWNDDTGSEDGSFTIYGYVWSTLVCN